MFTPTLIIGGLCDTMKVSLLKKYILGLVISITLIIINNGLVKNSIEDIFNNRFINLSALIIFCVDPIINLITFAGIVLTYYFIIKIYIIIFKKEN